MGQLRLSKGGSYHAERLARLFARDGRGTKNCVGNSQDQPPSRLHEQLLWRRRQVLHRGPVSLLR